MFVALLLSLFVSMLSCSLATECGQGGFSQFVVGGREAVPNNWPWQVSLSLKGYHLCGGTIVAPSWILTAGHCFFGKLNDLTLDWVVTAGEHDLNSKSGLEQRRKIAKILINSAYEGGASKNDIALLKLESPLKYGKGVGPACLPEANAAWDRMMTNCMLTGWGLTKGEQDKNKLQQLDGPIVDQQKCQFAWDYKLEDSMICFGTGLKGGCQGDSGGPLVCNNNNRWYHVGVVSYGVGSCKEAGYPTVFSRVSSFRKWVDRVIEMFGGPEGSGPEPEKPDIKGIEGPNCKTGGPCRLFVEDGKCGHNEWLQTVCPKDCGLCHPCGDKDVFCSEKAARGDCDSSRERVQAYMFRNCNYSCKLCQ